MKSLSRNHLADQAADGRSHDDLAARVGSLALNLPLQQVGRAEQTSHEDVDRPIVEFLRRTDLNDPAQVHHGQAVRQRECLDGVVRQDQDRDSGLRVNPPQVVPEILASSRIERAQRLVEDQELGLRHQGPRQGRSQPLEGRQLLGPPAGQAVDP